MVSIESLEFLKDSPDSLEKEKECSEPSLLEEDDVLDSSDEEEELSDDEEELSDDEEELSDSRSSLNFEG